MENAVEELEKTKAALQEKNSNYLLLCDKYKALKKEMKKKDEIIINQDKVINELNRKLSTHEIKLNI